jgi:uncharacterized membrane protein
MIGVPLCDLRLAVADPSVLLPWFGRTHVVMVHFPIALLLVAGLAELWRGLRGARKPSSFSVTCVALGTLAAAWAVAAGFAHASLAEINGDAATTLAWHRSLGLATVAAGLTALLLRRSRAPLWIWRGVTLAGAGLVIGAGHFGGELTHGAGYLTEVFAATGSPAAAPMSAGHPPAGTVARVTFPANGRIDFVKHVQPILATSCHECHGPTVRRGGLRLDSKASALKGGKAGPAVVPREVAKSTLLARLAPEVEPGKRMPSKQPPLPADQIRILRTWIEQGAVWPDAASFEGGVEEKHWAYVRPIQPKQPAVRNAAWPRNAIDRFVLARLEREQLTPAPAAERLVLLRRVYLDLTGIPPTPAEADEFLADLRPDAYERVVDRLLASPHYGERWALRWLDLARYADSNGYEKDRLRTIWPWRDWVVDALNRDLPFDQFTIEQLAGDLLPNATTAQKVATGFHRNTMLNQEGGADPEEFRVAANVDRVNTTATVWLGSTLACAQCHDHKYDPFSQRDYFQLYAFFNQTTDESRMIKGSLIEDISARLTIPRPDEERLRQRASDLARKIADADVSAELAAWEKSQAAPGWQPLTIVEAVASRAEGTTLTVQADGSILAGGTGKGPALYTLTGRTDLPAITALRLEVLPDPSLPAGGPGRGVGGDFLLNRLGVTAAPADEADYPDRLGLLLQSPTSDVAADGFPVTAVLTQKADETKGWRIIGAGGTGHAAAFSFAEPVGYQGGTRFTITLEHANKDAAPIGRFRLSVTGAAPTPHIVPAEIAAVLATPPATRTSDQRAALVHWFRPLAPSLQRDRDELARTQRTLATPLTTLVLEERKEPRETFIHERGSFLSPGAKVSPGVPGVLPPLPPEAPRNRLGLARWLVSPENPLTARVTVNRMWEAFFGRGLVATSEDFGIQGEEPVQRELLDWLATEFVRTGWSVKSMHRLIVTSATYRQSSAVSPALRERDPFNTLLAHGPRFRLEAELIRDQALAAAGLLSPKLGGPGVFPPQPANTWMFAFNEDRWIPSVGEDRWRRGLYTIWRRSAPFPSFMSFDATTREGICARRSRSNTPLQALTTLNDPQFFEAAVGLARRILREGGPDATARFTHAFRLAVVRWPKGEEVGRLVALQREQRAHFEKNSGAARALLADYLPAGETPTAELAAWTIVANVLLNLDEVLNKG